LYLYVPVLGCLDVPTFLSDPEQPSDAATEKDECATDERPRDGEGKQQCAEDQYE
jgi:hypothetical protein